MTSDNKRRWHYDICNKVGIETFAIASRPKESISCEQADLGEAATRTTPRPSASEATGPRDSATKSTS